jgi:hypothetical protein
MNQITNISIKCILSILFLLCLFKMPYSYYQFLRFTAFFAFLYFAKEDKSNNLLMAFWIISAFLINPFYKFWLTKPIWNIIDVFWSLILITSNFKLNKSKNKNEKNNI